MTKPEITTQDLATHARTLRDLMTQHAEDRPEDLGSDLPIRIASLTAMLIALATDADDRDLVLVPKADLITLIDTSLLPTDTDEDDWDTPEERSRALASEQRVREATCRY